MYNNYFGFREKPFKLVPNPEYLFLSKTHEIALAHLTYAADQGDGFVVIIGEVGTGKTTLCRNYLESLDDETDSAYIFNPHLEKNELLAGICHEYGIRTSEKDTKALLDILNEFLIMQNAVGRKVVLLLDEAQMLSVENLEMVRMLSNLETTRNKLLQIILVGQPELVGKLESYELRQLAQRISLNYELTPLSFEDTEAYIQHRIGIASKRYSQLFTANACRLAFRYSKGIPRLINVVADRALLVAFSQDKHKVSKSIMQTAISELGATTSPHKVTRPWFFSWKAGVFAAIVVLVIAVFLLYSTGIAPFNNSSADNVSKGETAAVSPKRNTFKVPVDNLVQRQTPTETTQKTGDENTEPAVKPIADIPADESESKETVAFLAIPMNRDEIIRLLGQMDTYDSRENCVAVLLDLWNQSLTNVVLIPNEVDHDSFFEIAARQYGLRRYEVQGDWELIRKISLPAILSLALPGQGEPVFLSMVGLRDNRLRLVERKGGDVYEVDFESISPYLYGAAHIFWKNIIGFDMIIGYGSDDRAVMMVKRLLQEIGYDHIDLSPEFDYDTRLAIREFQRGHQLKVDGLVGPLTKIMLLRESGTFELPKLNTVLRVGS
ncbi:MAG: AAA family ATPase [Desulfobacteraceae bacterium]|jgi:general secretion pathway protein A